MGLPFSAMNKWGKGLSASAAAGQVYDRHFKERNIDNFEEFHIAFVDFCNYFNTVMPGKDYDTPSREQIEQFYETWKNLDAEKKQTEFKTYIEEHVKEAAVDNSVLMAGLVAPAAAIILKKSGESIPQVKKFKVHVIPDVVFVPFCTLCAIVGATAVQINRKSKRKD